jgi:signal transduction histidine kinase
MSAEPRLLRRRLAFALTALAALCAALLGAGYWLSERLIEAATLPLAAREHWVFVSLAAGVAITAALAFWLSGWIAGRMLRPVDALVARLRGLSPETRGQRLEADRDYGELGAVVEAVNAHLAALDEYVERETAFAAAASHELRTPLTVIQGAAEVLAGDKAVPERVLARIERAVAQAKGDLDALLALSRRREPPPAQPLRLAELLPAVAEPYLSEARAQGTRVAWDVAQGPAVDAPPGAVGIVFTNLLRNALEAARGGDVRIRVAGDGFEISDSGPGLPPETLAPGPARARIGSGRGGGTGMGLYIARTLAARSGWSVQLSNNAAGASGGATARVRFSAEQPA